MTDDLHAIIADQAETIDQLKGELDRSLDKVQDLEDAQGEPEGYYQTTYDRIRSAWDAWAFAELGTASPTPLDLEGRRELDALWRAIK